MWEGKPKRYEMGRFGETCRKKRIVAFRSVEKRWRSPGGGERGRTGEEKKRPLGPCGTRETKQHPRVRKDSNRMIRPRTSVPHKTSLNLGKSSQAGTSGEKGKK